MRSFDQSFNSSFENIHHNILNMFLMFRISHPRKHSIINIHTCRTIKIHSDRSAHNCLNQITHHHFRLICT
ncbi:hypothetical protein Hanom_Chr10g00910441 [Helianthus anomalus]